jgi:VWFA-related protein
MRGLGTILLAAAALFAAALYAQDQPPIRVNTRLVEVDVVVRNSHGPIAGLTKQDFTLFDKGKPQEIAVFSVKSAEKSSALAAPAPLPPGVVANRLLVASDTPTGATVVLVDRLNTAFEFQPYMDRQLLQLLGSMKAGSPIALYTLGRELNPVYDFTEDPARLIRVAASLANKTPPQPGDEQTAKKVKTALEEVLNLEQVDRPFITADALVRISHHLSGVHGRKGLVWLSGSFPLRNPRIMRGTPDLERIEDATNALNDSNMAIYPVDVKGLSAAVRFGRRANLAPVGPPGADVMNALARDTGGEAFYNSNDISGAIQHAIEDAEATYTLGFYPSGDALDGKFHPLQVKVAKEELSRGADVRFREGYVASEAAPRRAKDLKLSLDEILDDPLAANAVGIAAIAAPLPEKPGTVVVRVQIDVADLLLEQEAGRWTGSLDFGVRWTDAKTAIKKVHRFAITANEEQLRALLASGFIRQELMEVGVPASGHGEIQVAVQDRATGAAGSVRVPLTGK